jgi:GNAT superfamily N-acetyltransferase
MSVGDGYAAAGGRPGAGAGVSGAHGVPDASGAGVSGSRDVEVGAERRASASDEVGARTGLRRVDDRLGLAVCRASLSGRTLVTYARDHVTVRTPSKPDFHDGNTLDLLAPPAADELAGWGKRFQDTVGQLGVRTVQLRWEEPAATASASAESSGAAASASAESPGAASSASAESSGGEGGASAESSGAGGASAESSGAASSASAESPGGEGGASAESSGGPPSAGAPSLPPAVVAAARELGLAVSATSVLLLDHLIEPPPADAELLPVAPPSAVPGGPVDRRWYAATVLYRYEQGETPDEWRAFDDRFVAWSVEVQRELALAERAQVWLAMRHGAPVARLSLFHDRQGLAVVEDVIVHPVHRRRGIAAALAAKAIATHLAVYPGTRVGIGAEPGSVAERLYRRLGFGPHATVWTLRSR